MFVGQRKGGQDDGCEQGQVDPPVLVEIASQRGQLIESTTEFGSAVLLYDP